MTRMDKNLEFGGVELMKASAGSGKTYSLAREYIRLLFKDRDPYAYRHILAVTFTNKATGEMKSRIIAELDTLACRTSESPYLEYLMDKCSFTKPEDLASASGTMLSNILGDYGSFHVSTIDTFFQKVLRAFSHEIGQVGEYQIDLDRKSLVKEAADRVLDSLTEDDDRLLKWLSASSIEQIQDGNGYSMERTLGEFAEGYMSDSYRQKASALGVDAEKAFSEENLRALRNICRRIIDDYRKGLSGAVTSAREYFKPLKDVKVYAALDKIDAFDHKKTIAFSGMKVIFDAAEDGSKAFRKTVEKCYGRAEFDGARDVCAALAAYAGRALAIRNTACLLLGQVYVFRVADALDKTFEALLKEKNVLGLDDTNSILHEIIGGTDAPFIYEKLGVRFNHFLLDEFQDTAGVQWENFLPLLRNSIAEGCYNLIVGDVKQSIYRWRNTDWRILDSKVDEELRRVVVNPLDVNWRSAGNIVEFNNLFYKELSHRMDAQLGTGLLTRIYSDVEQRVSGKIKVPGCVEAVFCGKDEIVDNTVQAVVEARDVLGFALKDIAVIVRTNVQGGDVAKALIDSGIDVVTNDSLKISSCATVRKLVACMYRFDNPDDDINSFYAGDFSAESVENADSLMDIAESILSSIGYGDDDAPYIFAFLDLLRDFVDRNGNFLNSFLQYWEEDGAGKNISSPEGADAVTVITIHKVKGLDYPYVVLPLPARGGFMKSDARYWECPDVSGTEFEQVEKALYRVPLAETSMDSLFAENYLEEQRMAFVDNANLWYVAMTRASQAMCMIGPVPPARLLEAYHPGDTREESTWPSFQSIPDALYMYVNEKSSGFVCSKEEDGTERYIFGEKSVKWTPAKSEPGRDRVRTADLRYSSFSSAENRGRLKVSAESRDFFNGEGQAGISASRRIRGTVIHGIMENVNVPEDLPAAVAKAVDCGDLDREAAGAIQSMLQDAMDSVAHMGWFDKGAADVINERNVIDTSSGLVNRPDRVVIKDGKVEIIDYKTGREEDAYGKQLLRYAESYRKRGFSDVRAYIWYINEKDGIREVTGLL